MTRDKTPARRFDVDVMWSDGEIHRGTATISRGKYPTITVSYQRGGTKTTQVGNTPEASIARLLLSELVGQWKTQHGESRA